MTPQEVTKLLAIASSHDNREISQAAVAAWGDSATRARWTYDEAAEAIKEYYTRTTAEKPWIMPSHITHIIRAEREHRHLKAKTRELAQLPRPRMNQLIQELADNSAIPHEPREPRAMRQPGLRVKCQHCGAEPGESCTRPTRGGLRVPSKPHPSRQQAGELQESTIQ